MKLLVADACAVVEFCCCCCGWERPGCGTTGWRGFPNGCALGVESLAGGEWATRWLRLMRWASLLDFALLLLLLFLAVALSMSRVSLSLLLSPCLSLVSLLVAIRFLPSLVPLSALSCLSPECLSLSPVCLDPK